MMTIAWRALMPGLLAVSIAVGLGAGASPASATGDTGEPDESGRAPAASPRPLHGMFDYAADAPRLHECLTGRSYPVAMDGDYVALERAYVALPDATPGAPVLATFDGAITPHPSADGSGAVATVVVQRFSGLWPGQNCERTMSNASLAPQYWRVASLRGQRAGPVADSREPHLILRGPDAGYRVDGGCGPLEGTYRADASRIGFDEPARTVSCPDALVGQQAALLGVLADARSWRISGLVLEFFDDAGHSLALLEAVHLR